MYLHHKATATAEEVKVIVDKIGPILDGESTQHVLLACLFIAFVIQNPDIKREDLAEGIKGASEYIALFLDSKEAKEEAIVSGKPELMN